MISQQIIIIGLYYRFIDFIYMYKFLKIVLHLLNYCCINIFQVDVENAEPVAAFCSSDDDGGIEDKKEALMFLPIAPEIEDPEPDMPPPPVLSFSSSSKFRTYDIHLDTATDGQSFFF